MVDVFDELPLDRGKETLRLWTFFNDDTDEQPQLILSTFSSDERPPYIALSYEWGRKDVDARAISVNEGHLTITKNLWDFIVLLFRKGDFADMWFFADQISMNQENLLERNHQVSIMGTIYANADRVFAWLSSHEFDADTDMFSKLDIPEAASTENLTILHMASSSYWTRLWIVQELHVARHVTLWYPNISMDGREFLDKLTRLANNRTRKLSHRALQEDFWPGLEALLDWTPSTGHRPLSWAVTTYGNNECSDVRDLIFGLQALVEPAERIAVDYSLSFGQIAHRALMSMVIHEPRRSDGMEPFVQLVRSRSPPLDPMRLKSKDGSAHQWAFFVPRIPRDKMLDVQGELRVLELIAQRSATEIPAPLQEFIDEKRPIVTLNYWQIFTEIRDSAVTPMQARFANELQNQAMTLKERLRRIDTMAISDAVGIFDAQVRELGRYVVMIAIQLDFKMFGPFMYHPNEWHFTDVAISSIEEFLEKDAGRSKAQET